MSAARAGDELVVVHLWPSPLRRRPRRRASPRRAGAAPRSARRARPGCRARTPRTAWSARARRRRRRAAPSAAARSARVARRPHRRFVQHEREGEGAHALEQAPAGSRLARREAEKQEAVGRQARPPTSAASTADGTGDGHDARAGGDRRRDDPVARDRRRAACPPPRSARRARRPRGGAATSAARAPSLASKHERTRRAACAPRAPHSASRAARALRVSSATIRSGLAQRCRAARGDRSRRVSEGRGDHGQRPPRADHGRRTDVIRASLALAALAESAHVGYH